MEHVLYRKYRPKSFKDTIGQGHITKTLQQALKSGRISHAYLFTGPRGVGKTSVARILAYAVNNIPYEDNASHLDIIEIDAASNRRIDEIRELRDKVRVAPAAAKYKVYIIDEVHMLTREAFNALLKTLEEPPAHTIFILATTEAHKLPETIISRTQRFEFKPVSTAKVAQHLNNIAHNEKITITPEALNLLAEFGSGSFRDSIGYLDQLSAAGKVISEDEVRQILGLPSQQGIAKIITSLNNNDVKMIIDTIQGFKEQGVAAPELAASISKSLREQAVNGGSFEADLLKQLIDVKASLQPYEFLEIALLETIAKKSPGPNVAAAIAQPRLKSSSNMLQTTNQIRSPKKPTASLDISIWPEVIRMSKNRAASLYTALRLAKPSVENGNLILVFQFPLHKKKVEQAKHLAIIGDIFEELTGQKISVSCVVDKNEYKDLSDNQTKPTKPHVPAINSISKVFGTAEMLEA